MSQRPIGTEPIQVAVSNPNRHQLTVQLLPNSIAPGNTGLVFGKWGSAPKADINSNTWDFVLNSGAADGTNFYDATDKAHITQELWLISDTAGQLVNVVEQSTFEAKAAPPSGAAAA